MTFSKSMRRQILAKHRSVAARVSRPCHGDQLQLEPVISTQIIAWMLNFFFQATFSTFNQVQFSILCKLLTSYFLHRVIVKHERVKNGKIFGRQCARYLRLCLTKILLIFVLCFVRIEKPGQKRRMKIQIFEAKVQILGLKRSKMDCRGFFRNVLVKPFGSKVNLKFSLK